MIEVDLHVWHCRLCTDVHTRAPRKMGLPRSGKSAVYLGWSSFICVSESRKDTVQRVVEGTFRMQARWMHERMLGFDELKVC